VKMIAGRDFNAGDRRGGERVVVVSQSLAQRMFPSMDVVDRRVMWTDPVTKFIGVSTEPRRIVGIVPDIDDEHIVPGATMTIYQPLEQEPFGGRMFVHAKVDPYSLVPTITKIIRELASDQPVERAATLDDIRAEVLTPNRVNALVFSGFAGVALAIAVVGVAGVLAFSVSARTREFGVRLAIGSSPAALLTRVLKEGAVIGVSGIVTGAIAGLALTRVVSSYITEIEMPGMVPILAAAAVLVTSAILASLMPAARASRVDVISALRAD
jgi:putative ABC transport system permease protein